MNRQELLHELVVYEHALSISSTLRGEARAFYSSLFKTCRDFMSEGKPLSTAMRKNLSKFRRKQYRSILEARRALAAKDDVVALTQNRPVS